MSNLNRHLLVCVLSLLFFAAQHVAAQQLTAQIKGTVTDATGAAVPGAQVTATNVQTGVDTTVPSGNDGSFQFLQLPVGVYNLSVSKSGFTTFKENNIRLELDQI